MRKVINSQVPAIKSQVFLHQTLHFNHSQLVMTAGATGGARKPVQLGWGGLNQSCSPALHIQPSRNTRAHAVNHFKCTRKMVYSQRKEHECCMLSLNNNNYNKKKLKFSRQLKPDNQKENPDISINNLTLLIMSTQCWHFLGTTIKSVGPRNY